MLFRRATTGISLAIIVSVCGGVSISANEVLALDSPMVNSVVEVESGAELIERVLGVGTTTQVVVPTETRLLELDTASRDTIQRARDVYAVTLLRSIYADSDGIENISMSPSAIHIALSNVAALTTDKARQEINTITAGGTDSSLIELYNKEYIDSMTSGRTQFAQKTGMWFKNNAVIKDFSLSRALRSGYDTNVGVMNFGTSRATSIINNWAETATDGRIKKALTRLDANAPSYLMNVSTFKGALNRPFDPTENRINSFYNAGGKEINIEYMYRKGDHVLIDNEFERGIIMHYNDGKHKLMLVYPKEQYIDEYIETISYEYIKNVERSAREVESSVWVPKFNVELTRDLTPFIQGTGITSIFNGQGVFDNFLQAKESASVYMGSMNHNALFSLNEYGTAVDADSAPPVVSTNDVGITIGIPRKVDLKVNEPFMYVLLGDRGEVKHIGVINTLDDINSNRI